MKAHQLCLKKILTTYVFNILRGAIYSYNQYFFCIKKIILEY